MILIKYKNIEMWGLLFSSLRRANFSRSYENFLRVIMIRETFNFQRVSRLGVWRSTNFAMIV